jgi:hypothetical protein
MGGYAGRPLVGMDLHRRRSVLVGCRLARSQCPGADIPELAALIVARMDADALLALATDTLAYWPSAPAGGRYAMAKHGQPDRRQITSPDVARSRGHDIQSRDAPDPQRVPYDEFVSRQPHNRSHRPNHHSAVSTHRSHRLDSRSAPPGGET